MKVWGPRIGWALLAAPGLYQIVLLLIALGGRLFYPYDLEWMEGGMLHHALRIQTGHGIYTPPSIDFIPYLYTPLYPALLAVLGEIFGLTYTLGRTVSDLALVGIAAVAVGSIAGRRFEHPSRGIAFAGAVLALGLFAVAVIGWAFTSPAERGRPTIDVAGAALIAVALTAIVLFTSLGGHTLAWGSPPIVGLIADTFDRRWIVRGTTALLTLNAAMLGLLTWANDLSLPFLFLAAGFVGVARAFSGPAYSALAPNLVPRESLPTAIAVSSIAWQAGTIAGPSVGGVLYAIHPDVAYGSISALLAFALGTMFLIGKVPQPPAQKDRHPLHRIADGFAYVRNNRLVLAAITLDLFVVLLAGATALAGPLYQSFGPHAYLAMIVLPVVSLAILAGFVRFSPRARALRAG